jgi:hypothetical protein
MEKMSSVRMSYSKIYLLVIAISPCLQELHNLIWCVQLTVNNLHVQVESVISFGFLDFLRFLSTYL